MTFKKKEKVTLAVVAILFAGVLLSRVVSSFFADKAYKDAQSKKEEETVSVPAGKTIDLRGDAPDDAASDALNPDDLNKNVFGWVGTMRMSVTSARAYESAAALDDQVPADLAQMFDPEDSQKSKLLVVTIHLENVDARPAEMDFEDNPCFRISTIAQLDEESSNLEYFSGSTVPKGDHDYFCFQLPVGGKADYTLGYFYGDLLGRHVDVPSVIVPGLGFNEGKYRLELNATLVG
ncbi:hypothetical protein [Olsenella massiliensis]|uniref:hypothetical protein n=1 Tax=Olsenella massiliensis TaxID=1622075 RepID=UPI00071D04BE|nr:hypothetical protein [Olsenella massiliensis]